MRASILFQTLREPPPKGSVRESILIMYVMHKEEAEHAKFRALAQLLVDKEAGVKAFEEYFDLAFPHVKKEAQREGMSLAKALQKEVSRGPIAVSKVGDNKKVRSRLKVRYNKRSKELADSVLDKVGSPLRFR